MEPERQLDAIATALEETVAHVQVMQMNDPTPCGRFTVHDLLDHVLVQHSTFAHRFRDEDPSAIVPPAVYGWVPRAELREVLHDLTDAVNAPGALERTIASPLGDVTGRDAARFAALDALLHCWDLGTATGVSCEIPDDVIAAVESFARTAITPAMRANGMFAAPSPAPPGASTFERLIAFSGRRV